MERVKKTHGYEWILRIGTYIIDVFVLVQTIIEEPNYRDRPRKNIGLLIQQITEYVGYHSCYETIILAETK